MAQINDSFFAMQSEKNATRKESRISFIATLIPETVSLKTEKFATLWAYDVFQDAAAANGDCVKAQEKVHLCLNPQRITVVGYQSVGEAIANGCKTVKMSGSLSRDKDGNAWASNDYDAEGNKTTRQQFRIDRFDFTTEAILGEIEEQSLEDILSEI